MSAPAGFWAEPRPTKGFPLFSALRMASPDTVILLIVDYRAAIGGPRTPRANNLKLNSAKCCEIIISLPTSNRTNLPPPHTGLTRVEDITALGVTFTKTISF